MRCLNTGGSNDNFAPAEDRFASSKSGVQVHAKIRQPTVVLMDIITFLFLLRMPVLHNHVINWMLLILFSWLIQHKLVGKSLMPIRIITLWGALLLLLGLGEICFDPFWIIGYHMPLITYVYNLWYSNIFYESLIVGLVFFKFKLGRLWIFLLPLGTNFIWLLLGLHLPSISGDNTYYYDLGANVFDVLQQTTAYIAGYYAVNSLRWFV